MLRTFFWAVLVGLSLFQSSCACRQDQPASSAAPSSAPESPAAAVANSRSNASAPVEIIGEGYRMVKYTDTGGQRPKLGEVALVNMSNWVGDSLIVDSRTKLGGATMSLQILDRKAKPSLNAVFDAVLQMGIGDSISVYQPVTSGLRKQLPPRLANAEMRSDLVLIGITTMDKIKGLPLN